MQKTTTPKKPSLTRGEALAEFDRAPDTALFNQVIIAHIRDCSIATLERDRWAGGGIPFIKIGRAVKYRKADVLSWLGKHQTQLSTSIEARRELDIMHPAARVQELRERGEKVVTHKSTEPTESGELHTVARYALLSSGQ